MQIVILDYPEMCESAPCWDSLEALGSVKRFRETSLPQLLERARTADILVTRGFPFRREVLDYLTRPRIILVPRARMERLVEVPIARQLGILVAGFEEDDDPCGWIRSAAETLRSHAQSMPDTSPER
jgi:phosphoglycerate dehydrogenase-like enzyme